MEPKVVVGRNIAAERKRLGLTQEDLAYRAGVHPVEVGRAERGVRDMRLSTIAKLARGLGVPAMKLLRGSRYPVANGGCCGADGDGPGR